jgi:hypothetical protein
MKEPLCGIGSGGIGGLARIWLHVTALAILDTQKLLTFNYRESIAFFLCKYY